MRLHSRLPARREARFPARDARLCYVTRVMLRAHFTKHWMCKSRAGYGTRNATEAQMCRCADVQPSTSECEHCSRHSQLQRTRVREFTASGIPLILAGDAPT